MTTHDDSRLTAYVLGELDAHGRAAVEAAIAASAQARATVAEIRATAGLLESAFAAETVPDFASDSINPHVLRSAAASRRLMWLLPVGSGIAAGLALLVTIPRVSREPLARVPTPPTEHARGENTPGRMLVEELWRADSEPPALQQMQLWKTDATRRYAFVPPVSNDNMEWFPHYYYESEMLVARFSSNEFAGTFGKDISRHQMRYGDSKPDPQPYGQSAFAPSPGASKSNRFDFQGYTQLSYGYQMPYGDGNQPSPAQETTIPWHNDVLYPRNWLEISSRRDIRETSLEHAGAARCETQRASGNNPSVLSSPASEGFYGRQTPPRSNTSASNSIALTA
jgi:hypothetical protein